MATPCNTGYLGRLILAQKASQSVYHLKNSLNTARSSWPVGSVGFYFIPILFPREQFVWTLKFWDSRLFRNLITLRECLYGGNIVACSQIVSSNRIFHWNIHQLKLGNIRVVFPNWRIINKQQRYAKIFVLGQYHFLEARRTDNPYFRLRWRQLFI